MIHIDFPRANPLANFRVLRIQWRGGCLIAHLTRGWRGPYRYPRGVSRFQHRDGRGGLMLWTTRIEWEIRRSRAIATAQGLK